MIDTARKLRSKHVEKALGALLLLTGLAIMSGCQGLSAGGTGIQNPGTLGSSLSSISFGNVTVGKTQTISGTVTNKGSSSITLSQASISGAGYTLTGISANGTLSAGQSANFSVKFAPTSSGTSNGTLTVASNASNGTLTIPVSGTGTAAVGTLSASPSSLNFGSVTIGQNQTLSSTITNTGSASVTISQVGI
ncbi:MAG TPA: choice-of-anchor D domain-containing protein, partial [Nitrospira sp.]|nr:choice-of-anchor D domain-containing protein [Nitrospira sp.]